MNDAKNDQWLTLITNPEVLDRIKGFIQNESVLGIMLWGSRATGLGESDSDWDALVLITNDYYNQLNIKETAFVVYHEDKDPKKVLIDFSLWSEECAQQILDSPKDIDHWAWVEGKIIYDPQGKMDDWKEKISRYPDEEHEERLKYKFVDLVVSRYYAMVTEKRGYKPDSKLNAYRAILAAIHLWFTLKKSWTPSLKWWTEHAKRMGMKDEIYSLFSETLENPNIQQLMKVETFLKEEILSQGYDFPNDYLQMLLKTVHLTGRPLAIKHSYL
ncbi:MAG: DUF4037 domain-containing protein [Promethearchaeota archaeon]|jgi:predicted nucleotidyltransferase